MHELLGVQKLVDTLLELANVEQNLRKLYRVSGLVQLRLSDALFKVGNFHLLLEVFNEVCLVVAGQRLAPIVNQGTVLLSPWAELKTGQLEMEPEPAVDVVLKDVLEQEGSVLPAVFKSTTCHQVYQGFSAHVVLLRPCLLLERHKVSKLLLG